MRAFLNLILVVSVVAFPASIIRIACPPEVDTVFSSDDADPSRDPSAITVGIDWDADLPGRFLPLLPAPAWASHNFVYRPVLWAGLSNRPYTPRGPPPAG